MHPSNNIQRVAGMSIKSGRGDDVAFSLLENLGNNRWFLTNLLKPSNEDGENIDRAFLEWPKKMNVNHLILDVPLSRPPCHSCLLKCPGIALCPVEEVLTVKDQSLKILKSDQDLLLQGRKSYEERRVDNNQLSSLDMDFFAPKNSKVMGIKQSNEALLSKSYKRRLKKDFLPYWNRPLDFWVWQNYYDPLLNIFKFSYDSFGQTSFISYSRLNFLRKHLGEDIFLYESNIYIIFLEMLRSNVINLSDLESTTDYIVGPESKLNLIKKIEDQMGIFVYDQDLDMIIKDAKSFQSFILSCAGVALAKGTIRILPKWCSPNQSKFIAPLY